MQCSALRKTQLDPQPHDLMISILSTLESETQMNILYHPFSFIYAGGVKFPDFIFSCAALFRLSYHGMIADRLCRYTSQMNRSEHGLWYKIFICHSSVILKDSGDQQH